MKSLQFFSRINSLGMPKGKSRPNTPSASPSMNFLSAGKHFSRLVPDFTSSPALRHA
jgi:hypothetical protein